MDYLTIKKIAKGVIESSAACDGQFFTGTVTSADPLKIKLGDESGSIELDGDDIILTQSVVSKKLYIKKHSHEESQELIDATGTNEGGPVIFTPPGGPTLTLGHKHTIATSTLDAWVTEYGYKLPVDPSEYNQSGEQVVITLNRGLEEGDKVVMTRVSNGQQFIVLSRYFEVDKPGEDDA